jgi:hypothetical protein
MNVSALTHTDVSALESLLIGEDGFLRPAPYAEVNRFTQEEISYFCWKHGIYQVPTTELIDWLRSEIGGRRAIEIGAGNGSVGKALGITITDSRLQERPDIAQHYALMRQPAITYHRDTVLLDGNEAVRKLDPQVVVACWVTQLWTPDVQEGNYWGVDECELVSHPSVEQYIHVGNDRTHARKKVLGFREFERHKFDWLVSRSQSREDNVIYVYRRK